jgi:hypothetical protein
MAVSANNKIVATDISASLGKNSRAASVIVGSSLYANRANEVDYLCTGTNDQNVIQAAINSLGTNGGKVLLLDGTYYCNDSILFSKPNVEFCGIGNSTIIVAAGNFSYNFLFYINNELISIHSFRLKIYEISISYVFLLNEGINKIYNLNIDNNYNTSICFYIISINNDINNCIISGFVKAIYCKKSNIKITNCSIYVTLQGSISISTGIDITQSNKVIVANNYIYVFVPNNSSYGGLGVYIHSSASSGYDCKLITIANNIIHVYYWGTTAPALNYISTIKIDGFDDRNTIKNINIVGNNLLLQSPNWTINTSNTYFKVVYFRKFQSVYFLSNIVYPGNGIDTDRGSYANTSYTGSAF